MSAYKKDRIITLNPNAAKQYFFIKRASTKDSDREPSESNLFFFNTHLSKEHACLKVLDGMFYIRDCHSTFGTVVNGEVIVPSYWFPLEDGDIVRFIVLKPSGYIKYVFESFPNSRTIPLNRFEFPQTGLSFKVNIPDSNDSIKFTDLDDIQVNKDEPTYYPSRDDQYVHLYDDYEEYDEDDAEEEEECYSDDTSTKIQVDDDETEEDDEEDEEDYNEEEEVVEVEEEFEEDEEDENDDEDDDNHDDGYSGCCCTIYTLDEYNPFNSNLQVEEEEEEEEEEDADYAIVDEFTEQDVESASDVDSEESEAILDSESEEPDNYEIFYISRRKRLFDEIEDGDDDLSETCVFEPSDYELIEAPPSKKLKTDAKSTLKTVAKELFKGSLYVIGTVLALGIYGQSISEQ